MLLTGIGLGLATLPLGSQTATWALVLVVVCVAARFFLATKKRRLPPVWIKVLVLVVGVTGILLQYGSVIGIDAGLSILLVLISLKFLEANSSRDLQVLALLGFFLALCDLFFAQDLGRWFYVGGILLWLVFAVVFSQTRGVPGAVRAAFRVAVLMFLQALPLIVAMFLFFPRIYGGFRFQFSRSTQGLSGMSDRMEPGSLSSLALRQDVAFRADFPDGNLPTQSDLYWRGMVLWRGDGLTWVRGGTLSSERRVNSLGGERVKQRIVLQPYGGRWLFALDRPASIVGRATLEPGGYLQSLRPVFYPISYEVVSRPENRELSLPGDQRAYALQKPQHPSPQATALAEGWRAAARSNADIVEAATRFFQSSGFEYSLNPGTYGPNELDSFLFSRRLGFCEHYAGAFATLMRLAGVPSRVVLGYHGGQFNRHGNYVIVRQSDAHSWCEVWLEGRGWQRIDPTSLIAPGRITSGFDSYLDAQTGPVDDLAAQAGGKFTWQGLIRDTKLLWDSLAYRWDLWVLNFDEEGQSSFFLLLGIGAWEWTSVAGMLAGGAALAVGGLGVWLRFSGKQRDEPAVRWYGRLCSHLAKVGVVREPWEGPRHFIQRASGLLPNQATAIRRAGELYEMIRYAAVPPALHEFEQAVRAIENTPAERR